MRNFLKRLFHVNNIKQFYDKYERHIGAFTVLLGFVFDNLTLRDASISAQTTVFLVYLLLCAISIILLHIIESSEKGKVGYGKSHFWTFMLMQFTIGSLFSMFFVFYSRGVSIATSWPFLLLLILNMVSTEVFKKYYSRLSLQVTLLFIAVYSFFIYVVPVLMHEMSIRVFVLSGVLAVLSIAVFVHALILISRDRVKEWRVRIIIGVSVVLVLINTFYLTGVIPPVPLVMKKVGVYHSLAWDGVSMYVVSGEAKPWWGFLDSYPTYHHAPNDSIYVIAAVYAPTALATTIIHDWQYFDPLTNSWQSTARIRVPIVGGREDGYRTYSMKQSVQPGKWRVDVKTSLGQIIGRVRFEVVPDNESYEIIKDTY